MVLSHDHTGRMLMTDLLRTEQTPFPDNNWEMQLFELNCIQRSKSF